MRKGLTIALAAVVASASMLAVGCVGNKGYEKGKYNLEVAVQNEKGEIKEI